MHCSCVLTCAEVLQGWPSVPGSRWHSCLPLCREELKVSEVSVVAVHGFEGILFSQGLKESAGFSAVKLLHLTAPDF